jgi:hypothetical protein
MMAKLTEAQRKMLAELTPEFTRWKPRRGMPFLILNPTVEALRKRGLMEIATIPPRWRITPTGRAALAQSR